MKVMRKIMVSTDHFEVGDRIKVNLPGATYTATAIKDEGDGMLFILDQYLDEARPMNKEGGTEVEYEESDMRTFLQKVAATFPEKLKKRMVKFDNGDFLRLLTLPEMCGKDENFDDCEGQIPWMKQDRRHRIASRKGDEYEWGWLATVVSGEHSALVATNGIAYSYYASSSFGVRPVFKILLRKRLEWYNSADEDGIEPEDGGEVAADGAPFIYKGTVEMQGGEREEYIWSDPVYAMEAMAQKSEEDGCLHAELLKMAPKEDSLYAVEECVFEFDANGRYRW